MKTIQLTIDEDLLTCLDQTVGTIGISRSAFMRDAVRIAIDRIRMTEKDRKDAEGYARQPESAEEIAELEAWQSIQAWGDDWSEVPSAG